MTKKLVTDSVKGKGRRRLKTGFIQMGSLTMNELFNLVDSNPKDLKLDFHEFKALIL